MRGGEEKGENPKTIAVAYSRSYCTEWYWTINPPSKSPNKQRQCRFRSPEKATGNKLDANARSQRNY